MHKNILYVEDNKHAITFFSRVVNKLGDYHFVTREDGTSALELLEKQQDFQPEMILLDINLPGMNGFEILQQLRQKSSFKHVPVIMFTSSDDQSDIKKSYEYGANAYIIKPDSLHTLKEVLEVTFNFWLKHNVA